MTSQLYTDGDNLVLELLDEFGEDMTITRTDIVTGAITTSTIRAIVTNPVSYIIHPASLEPVDERLVANSLFKPMVTDTLTKSNGRFNVMRVDDISPAGYVMGYRLELRRA